jgi:glucose-1-phosphate thymidylyltransferase
VKGILLAGGSGTRLYPITLGVSKQLLPIYDKPMVYYPLSTLMLGGVRDVLLVSTPQDIASYERLDFVGGDSVSLALADNVFFGHGFPDQLKHAAGQKSGATVFGYWVRDPERYGVVEFAPDGRVLGIEEKPEKPRSHYAVVGIYFYDNRVLEIAAGLEPSPRGELEITDVNRVYLESGELRVETLGRGVAWLDTGTHASLLQAQTFVEAIQERQGLKVACIEEIAFRNGWIDAEQLLRLATELGKSGYGEYLESVAREEAG